MLEQDARNATKFAGVLSEHGVFELQNIDVMGVDLAMDQPGEIGIAKFAHRVRFDRPDGFLPPLQAHDVFDRRADLLQLLVRFLFMRIIEQDDEVEIARRASSRTV